MTETFCTSGAVKLKAGANASTLTATQYTELINQAESFINVLVKDENVNLVNDYASLSADKKKILEDAASSHAAIGAITYDMSGFNSEIEAQVALDVNYARFKDCIELLKDKKHTDYLRGV